MFWQAVPPAGNPITAAEVHAALARILAQPEYAPARTSPAFRWLSAAAHWVWDRLVAVVHWLFPHLDLGPSTWSFFGVVLRLLGTALGLALIAYLVYLVVHAVRRRRRPAQRDGETSAPASAEDWEALAGAAAAREDWRAAAMALYQAVLLRLSGVGAVTLDRAKTPGDYRRDLSRDDGALAARFETFLLGFERVAYGAERPGPDHYGRLMASAAVLSNA